MEYTRNSLTKYDPMPLKALKFHLSLFNINGETKNDSKKWYKMK